MYMKNDKTNFILTYFFIFFFYVLCEEEEGEKRGERHKIDRKSTRLNSSHLRRSRMPSSA